MRMICLSTSLRSSPPHRPLNPRKTPFLINPIIATPCHPRLNPEKPKNRRASRESGLCRAEFSHDAPFAAAIGACMLTSLVFPAVKVRDDETEAALDTTDARFAVMGIISFIPYFNWLSWVFSWLDTGNRRYAVYAVVYLAPYLRLDKVNIRSCICMRVRWVPCIFAIPVVPCAYILSFLILLVGGYLGSNLSLSPEDSWLPIASIIFGIIHVQLEASIRNGDIQGLQLFSEAAKHFKPISWKKDVYYDDEDNQEASEEAGDEVQ